MKLFSSTQMSWSEPLFFVVRLRERWGWNRRALLALVIAVVMFLAIHFTRNPQFGIGKAVVLSLVTGVFLVALLDVGNIQREVTIQEDCISYNSAMRSTWVGTFALKDIQRVRLMRPEDWNKPFGAMTIQTSEDVFLLGVPNKVPLATIANVLHRLGVAVELAGWEPSETDTRVQVIDEVVLPKGTARPSGTARIWPVDEQERRLNPPLATALAIAFALGPLFLSLLGLIAAGIYLYLKWGALETLSKWMIGGGAFAAVVVSFMYLVVAGQFLAARYSISVAKGILRTRPNARFSGNEDGLLPVEIFDRTAWTSAVSKSVDFGFLQIDERLRCLQFEGNKNRWDIPVTALTTCRIEEAHVGSEGNQNAEKRYYVVIALDRDGEPWEAGMLHTRTEFGNDGSEQRNLAGSGISPPDFRGRVASVTVNGGSQMPKPGKRARRKDTKTSEQAGRNGRWDAFLSHDTQDKSLAVRLEKDLQSDGLSVWVDHDNIRAGGILINELQAALKDSRNIVVLWSQLSSKSEWVRTEWMSVVNLNHQEGNIDKTGVIPCLLDGTRLEMFLLNYVHCDFRKSYKAGLEGLAAALGKRTGKTPSPPRWNPSDVVMEIYRGQNSVLGCLLAGDLAQAAKLQRELSLRVDEARRRTPDDVYILALAGYDKKNQYMIRHWNEIQSGKAPQDVLLIQSKEAFYRALSIQPEDPSALNGIGSVMILSRDLDAAEFFVQRALERAKEEHMPYEAAEHDLKLIKYLKSK